MTVIATDSGNRFSNVVKHEYEPSLAYCRELVTVNEAGAESYVVGTVLGLNSTTGKYAISVETAIDGTEDAVAVVIGNSAGEAKDFDVAATTDTKVLVIARGPVIVSEDALVLDASYDNAAKVAAAYASLASKGIVVAPTV